MKNQYTQIPNTILPAGSIHRREQVNRRWSDRGYETGCREVKNGRVAADHFSPPCGNSLSIQSRTEKKQEKNEMISFKMSGIIDRSHHQDKTTVSYRPIVPILVLCLTKSS